VPAALGQSVASIVLEPAARAAPNSCLWRKAARPEVPRCGRIGRAPIRARLRESEGHGQMKRAVLTEEQIIGVLREREASAGRKSRIIAAF